MHVILASIGTDGDVLPYVGLGIHLRERGHRITLLASENFRHLADEQRFGFAALVTNDQMHALLANPDFWHPTRTARHSAQWGAGLLRQQYETVAWAASEGESVLVANPGVLAARVVQEKLHCPMASVVLQPWMIKSIVAPPVMPGRLYIPRWAPRTAYRLLYRVLDLAGGWLIGPALYNLRAELGLAPLRQPIFHWWWSEQRILGLFPDWFGPPARDWLPQIQLTGFPLPAASPPQPLSPDVLEFCHADRPPIVFSFGTGMMHAAKLFEAAVNACRDLGRPGIFLTRYPSQLPQDLPESIRHWLFVPLASLLPHCGAIVHHGGIGTVASALAAATPQLIVPFAFDQPDNADRVHRLGVGEVLSQNRANGRNLARALSRLLDGRVQERSQALASRFYGIDGLAHAVDSIENHCGGV